MKKLKRFLRRNMFNIPLVIILLVTMGLISSWDLPAETGQGQTIYIDMPVVEPAPEYEPTVQDLIVQACHEHGIDPSIPLAISRLETGNWTSIAFTDCNNVGGLSVNDVPLSYDTVEQGVDAFVSNLAKNYFGEGLDTVEKIAPKYCPPNAEDWARVVNELM